MKTRDDIVQMVKAWNPSTSSDDDLRALDAALFQRSKEYGEKGMDGLLAWAVHSVAAAVTHYREAVREDQMEAESVLGCIRMGGRLRGNARGFGGPRMSVAAFWHEKIADAQGTLARILAVYACQVG